MGRGMGRAVLYGTLAAGTLDPFDPPLPVLINGLLIHMFGVGLPSALAAAAAPRPTEA